jgi:ABC-2 type transport system ATP-binding protein
VVDHGIVIARGDARSLKRQVGGDNIGVTISDHAKLDDVAAILSRVTGAEAVIDRPARTATAPTGAGVAGLAAVANALSDAGHEVEDLSLRQPTLDEVFLTLTGIAPDDADQPHGDHGDPDTHNDSHDHSSNGKV